jgi:ADP-heptose:LPS heptosyltransferase
MRAGAVYHKQLGDLVLLQPALARLAEESGGEAALFTRPEFKPLEPLFERVRFVEGKAPLLDRLECLDDGSRTLKRACFIRSRRRRLLVPVPQRRRWWHRFFFEEVRVLSPVGRYRAGYYLEAVGGAPSQASPCLLPPPAAWKPARAPEETYALLHLTSGWRRKSWPAASWIDLATRLLDSGHSTLVLSAGNKDHELETTREVREAFQGNPRVLCLAGGTSLAEYLWLLHHARLVVTVDGSASHLAAAWRRPCVTLFGPTDPAEWHSPRPDQIALHGGGPRIADRFAGDVTPAQAAEAAGSVLEAFR